MSEASQQLVRQWKILQTLESARQGYTVQELREEHEVGDKTIRRDLQVLQTVFPITAVSGEKGLKRWKMAPLSEQLSFTYTDLISVVMSRRFLEPLAGTPFWEGHHKVLRKIKGALGEHGFRYCEKLNGFLHATGFGRSNYTSRGQMIDRLIVAMEDRKRVLVVYQSMQSTEAVTQELGPQGFIWHNGSLYLVAWSARRREIRNYKLDRIESVEIGAELQYAVPDDFSLEEWQKSAFGAWHGGNDSGAHLIRIHFSRDSARYVQEGFWHHSQQFEPQADGAVILSMQVSDHTPVVKWILSFGPNARVLEPSSLIHEITKNLQTMMHQYSTDHVEPVPTGRRNH